MAKNVETVDRPRRPKERQVENEAVLGLPLLSLPGIGERAAASLAKLGIESVGGLLEHFPRRHDDFTRWRKLSELGEGEKAPVDLNVVSISSRRLGRGQTMFSALVSDGETAMEATLFAPGYMERSLPAGCRLVAFGSIQRFNGALQFKIESFEVIRSEEDSLHLKGIVPLYPLRSGVNPRQLRRAMRRAVTERSDLPEMLPFSVRRKRHLTGRTPALRDVHFPPDARRLEEARRRLVYEELFLLQTALAMRRAGAKRRKAPALPLKRGGLSERFLASLPFKLTREQRRVLSEVAADMERDEPMSRLLQGDVGTGKTVIAVAAMLRAVENGAQAAMLAPTEVLAGQHLRVVTELLESLGVRVRSLSAAAKAAERKEVAAALLAGEIDILMGTHAILNESLRFRRLAAVVIDEQHKFGVLQRDLLVDKGEAPHCLVMTATPIPRTLSMTLYGDLDVSTIRVRPSVGAGFQTVILGPDGNEAAYSRIREEVAAGGRAYIVCPLVEGSDAVIAKSAEKERARLAREVFPDIPLGLLHGRMDAAAKYAAIGAFKSGETPILVATTVVEVGVDVPEATVMLIEGADRFGLSQLHQLRGRVGRGPRRAVCYLAGEPRTEESERRLRAMAETDDGFLLAERDLEIRGEGQIFGARQSGRTDLRIARLLRDVELLSEAREDAFAVIRSDPALARPEDVPLRRAVWKRYGEDAAWLERT